MDNIFVQKQTINEPQLLSKRLSWNNGKTLSKTFIKGSVAKSTIEQIKQKVKLGQYQLEEYSCFCGGKEGLLISEIDRYGFYYPLVICKNCGLIRANPRMNKAAYEKFYANEYRAAYGASEQPIDELFKSQQKHHRIKCRYISENITLPHRAVIFDIGCDFGTMLQQFANQGHEVYGCDYGIEHLDYGRRKTGIEDLILGGYEVLESIEKKADLIILSHVIEHFLELESTLRRIRKLLKPAGICYVAVPGTYKIENSFLKNDIIGLLQNAHIYQFSLNSLRYVMECCGFSFIKSTEEIEAFFQFSENFRSKADYPAQESRAILNHLQAAEKKFLIREKIVNFLERIHLHTFIKNLINKIR